MNLTGDIDVSILVVSYNTAAMTVAALQSIERGAIRTRHEILVVDNASTDGSPDQIAEHPMCPHLIASQDNLGFAAANNLAAKSARGRYLLLLNPDTLVLEGAIDGLIEFAQARPDARIWGGRTLFADGSLNPTSCWRRMTFWNQFCRAAGLTGLFSKSEFFNGEAYGNWQRDAVREVDIVSGCFLLIERDFWNELGGFDPVFFMYGEEADLCLRAKKLGARPAVTPAATIIHYGGASEKTRTAKMIKLLAAKISLLKRHWHPSLAPIGVLLLQLWPLSRSMASRARALAANSSSARENSSTWHEIWRRRNEWNRGYHAVETVDHSRSDLVLVQEAGN